MTSQGKVQKKEKTCAAKVFVKLSFSFVMVISLDLPVDLSSASTFVVPRVSTTLSCMQPWVGLLHPSATSAQAKFSPSVQDQLLDEFSSCAPLL